LLALLPACVTTEEYNRAKAANAALQREIDDLKGYQKGLSEESKRLSGENTELKARAVDAAWLEKEKKRLEELAKQFETGGASAMSGVSVIRTPEGVAFQVQGEILFTSGRADISESGKETLKKLIPTLLKEGKRLRVDGHTDSDPIKHSQWLTNLRLSAERSLVVTEFLILSGFPSDRIGIGAFGEFRPAVGGDGSDAKRQNRRVEILMLNAN
jgi:chemotaxis protein MotB